MHSIYNCLHAFSSGTSNKGYSCSSEAFNGALCLGLIKPEIWLLVPNDEAASGFCQPSVSLGFPLFGPPSHKATILYLCWHRMVQLALAWTSIDKCTVLLRCQVFLCAHELCCLSMMAYYWLTHVTFCHTDLLSYLCTCHLCCRPIQLISVKSILPVFHYSYGQESSSFQGGCAMCSGTNTTAAFLVCGTFWGFKQLTFI